jgi:hypothetical protein
MLGRGVVFSLVTMRLVHAGIRRVMFPDGEIGRELPPPASVHICFVPHVWLTRDYASDHEP